MTQETMGFNRGKATHKNEAGHHFRNDPDLRHQTCMTCGCKMVITYRNKTGERIYSYFDRFGNPLESRPAECKGLYDLLNEE